MSPSFALLMPVKTLSLAKSRLQVQRAGRRGPLMRAFALDAIAAATRATAVTHVYVVTEETGFETLGAVRLPDEGRGDLNRALRHAWERVGLLHPSLGVVAMCADLPCLSADDLDRALSESLAPRWFVADAAGTGTTLLAARPGVDLDPRFGAGSARRHEESGATPLQIALSTLRTDVDTEADLERAATLGVGRHTTAALSDRDTA